ncbi:cysteine desulfurase NifS [Calderihabitans maritimus]|uniref:Cysteine desulfurase IscS n=1 Tax=Calderihabitans maritimus TaxID=1246530 RepID=A0A1Z5HTM8_9FIRM|nr:cysteine desulfurase NifS [Calderihabitans maritimus]GAW92687.1 cysteine sulfinate desulfinase/cysteine desulfurase and related enzymes [Calderihabitans maritimus]
MRRVYLDHSATTPVDPEVAELMVKYLTDTFGNPSSVHSFGREAKKGLEEAREKVAALMGARPDEIVFTSGGTEADNLAIMGTAFANRNKGNHIITSAIEHHAVLDTCENLKKHGFEVTFLPVDADGLVKVEDVAEAITDKTILITIMHANNEVGTIQPIEEIGRLAQEKGIIFHTDAVQTYGRIPVNVDKLNVNLLSASSHKIYGPKGVGCLYIRKGTRIQPIAFGGGQERKRRPGTENMPGIVGFGKAAELAGKRMQEEMERLTKLRDKLIDGVLNRIDDVQLNGHRTKRLPGHVNFSFHYIEGESLLLSLDMKGIAASSGSACTSGSLDPSHVLLAMGIPHEIAHGSVRMTLGKDNTEEDIDYVLEVLPGIVERLRSMSPLYQRKEACKHKECYQNV